jgi:hypothetical protein
MRADQNLYGCSVRILAGMKEFHGRTGTAVDGEDGRSAMYRIRLDEPLYAEKVGTARDDVWER